MGAALVAQTGVTIGLGNELVDGVKGQVDHRLLEGADRAGTDEFLVEGDRIKLAVLPLKQPDGIVRIESAAAHEFSKKKVSAGDPVGRTRGLLECPANFGLQLGSDPFITIQYEHPVLAGGINRKLLLLAIPLPIPLDDPGSKALGNRHRVVGGTAVHDQYLAGKLGGSNCRGDFFRLIECNDYYRER